MGTPMGSADYAGRVPSGNAWGTHKVLTGYPTGYCKVLTGYCSGTHKLLQGTHWVLTQYPTRYSRGTHAVPHKVLTGYPTGYWMGHSARELTVASSAHEYARSHVRANPRGSHALPTRLSPSTTRSCSVWH
jgi:hypothetical protein